MEMITVEEWRIFLMKRILRSMHAIGLHWGETRSITCHNTENSVMLSGPLHRLAATWISSFGLWPRTIQY